MALMPGILHLLKKYSRYLFIVPSIIAGILVVVVFYNLMQLNFQTSVLANDQKQLMQVRKELAELKNQDQYKRNEALHAQIKSIESSYKDAVKAYETIQDLKAQKQKTETYEKELTKIISLLAQSNYTSASASLITLNKQITTDQEKIQAANTPKVTAQTANAPASNTPPDSGYAVQKVTSDIGDFTVAIISAELSSTRVIIDTASDTDCRDNCPVLPLSTYVARSGAFAGINGSYFCPASYPSCAGKTNSFDTLLMNKNKVYFNSNNNVYSNVPVAVFGNGFARFIGASSGWGRDTSVDGVIANQPLLLSGRNIAFNGDGDPKKGSKGSRSFVGAKGSKVYIGVVYNATVAEAAHALKALGLDDALNLDSGGSIALWFGGYKAGPGRDIPNAVLFVHK